MEIYNTVVQYDNTIDETINQINIGGLVDNVIEKIDNTKLNNNTDDKELLETDYKSKKHSKDCIAIDIELHKKHSECTICTESISDSSSDHESENFKCNTCSNRVHPICVYNYGIYHNLDDLNSIPCYVCEKGTLTPNNSIGKKLKSIANKIRQKSSNNTENLRIDNDLHQHLLSNNSVTNRREILERSGYFEEEKSENSDNGDNDENSETSENSYNSDSNETTIDTSYVSHHREQIFIESRMDCCFSIIKIIFIFGCFTCCIFTVVAYFTFKGTAY